ncbi:oxysterol binding protein [Dendrothele bispora CBS 962.96]|uniref:Oxysterol binding protein n=1 Tax=Dendrothele bispora (strain CBS 962.96) TaxID=1314807 RepID=A0A4S8LQZ7_DENBC|nr:oxysterol binding protein [Dendrothele bispora CBS 962.96]THU94868.1 oxysterol binding protein [Dendrothele bispora CBS 962.96]
MSVSHRHSFSFSSVAAANSPVIQEGWVLKKRRKKMQGFARRYFVLQQSGTLSYSFEPGQPIRDQIFLPNAAISTATGRKDIHIDSNNATFHIKCLSTEDFNLWMVAFRKFIAPSSEARRSASVRLTSRQGLAKLSKSVVIAEEMGTALSELEEAFSSLRDSKVSSSSTKSKGEKDKAKFGLFGKKSHHNHANEHGVTENGRPDSSQLDSQSIQYQRIRTTLDTLIAQHDTLLKSLQGTLDTQGHHVSTVPETVEEEDHPSHKSDSQTSSPTLSRNRHSIATTLSESVNEWFDASEGAEEFVLDDAVADAGEQPSYIMTNESPSEHDAESIDTDIESEDIPVSASPADETQTSSHDISAQVVRRTHLPTPITGDEGSLFTVLKKNVGKDLSTIAFPVTFNEPLTLLQRAAEELEYFSLLDQAAGTSDPIERLQFVAAFAVSGYAHTRHRTGRKGFNPMLAETFEDPRMKFIAEKVRHNPVEMAYHAEGTNWQLYATSAGKTKFWGKSLEIIPLGTTHLKMGDDHYQWKKPSSFMRNLMVGTKYLEHVGKMVIENTTDDSRCVLEFKQNGYWGAANVVSGTVYDSSGTVKSQLEGKWDEQFTQTVDSSHLVVLWRVNPWPKQTHEYYGFTSFGITLNEMSSDVVGKLPPTDSRLRPDVRALEEGDLDTAESEKNRVEEMQRERRRKGKEPQPRWFKQEGDEWVYAGGYWEARAKGWKGSKVESLW